MTFWKKRPPKPLVPNGPKAVYVTPLGNHIVNLAALNAVALKPLGQHSQLGVPVWVDVPHTAPTTQTYDGLLWEIEPMGEYLYYLAGDFSKNDQGLLRYENVNTFAQVHVNFENDVIDVASFDEPSYQEIAESLGGDHTDWADSTISEMFAQTRERIASHGRMITFTKLRDPRAACGWAYMQCDPTLGTGTTLTIRCSILDETEAFPRLTQILLRSSDAKRRVGDLTEAALELMERYANVTHHPLSGATRM